MKQRTRIYYSAQQRELMWDRWKQGDSLHDIARIFDRGHSAIQRIIRETGGFRPSQGHNVRTTPVHAGSRRGGLVRLT
jgi:hypothetical protein